MINNFIAIYLRDLTVIVPSDAKDAKIYNKLNNQAWKNYNIENYLF